MKTKTPTQALLSFCWFCTGGNRKEVETCNCGDPEYHLCAFHPYRTGGMRVSVKILRRFCLQCMGGCHLLVRECKTEDCPIHPFRLGKNPARAGQVQKAFVMSLVRAKRGAVSLINSVQNEFSMTGIGEPVGYTSLMKNTPESASKIKGDSI